MQQQAWNGADGWHGQNGSRVFAWSGSGTPASLSPQVMSAPPSPGRQARYSQHHQQQQQQHVHVTVSKPCRVVYIGGLNASVTEDDILSGGFQDFGEIEAVNVYPRGKVAYAFIHYKNIEDAVRAQRGMDGRLSGAGGVCRVGFGREDASMEDKMSMNAMNHKNATKNARDVEALRKMVEGMAYRIEAFDPSQLHEMNSMLQTLMSQMAYVTSRLRRCEEMLAIKAPDMREVTSPSDGLTSETRVSRIVHIALEGSPSDKSLTAAEFQRCANTIPQEAAFLSSSDQWTFVQAYDRATALHRKINASKVGLVGRLSPTLAVGALAAILGKREAVVLTKKQAEEGDDVMESVSCLLVEPSVMPLNVSPNIAVHVIERVVENHGIWANETENVATQVAFVALDDAE